MAFLKYSSSKPVERSRATTSIGDLVIRLAYLLVLVSVDGRFGQTTLLYH